MRPLAPAEARRRGRPSYRARACRGRSAPARVRGAARAPARPRAPPNGGDPGSGAAARQPRRPREPLPRRAPVHADGGARAGRRRDRPRSRPRRADGAPPAGRRRLGQDGRRALRPPACRRARPPGRPHGADRDARGAALPDRGADLPRARRPLRARDELGPRAHPRRGDGEARLGRGGPRRRHACVDPGGCRVPLPRRRRRGRAASLRRRATGARSPRTAAAPPRTGST